MKEQVRHELERLDIDMLANFLPSVIWIDGFPCKLRITREDTIYSVEYVDYDPDGEQIMAKANGMGLTEAVINMLLQMLDMGDIDVITYEDEEEGNDHGHKENYGKLLEP